MSALLSRLTLLAALAIAVATAWIHGLQLIAEALDAIESGVAPGCWPGPWPSPRAFCASRIWSLRFCRLEAICFSVSGELGFTPRRSQSALFWMRFSVSFVSRSPSASRSLLGGRTLVGSEIALRVAHLLLQLREIVGQTLALIGEFLRFLVDFPADRNHVGLTETSCEGRGTGHLAKLLLLIFFLLSEAIGFARHGVEAAVGVLLLRATEKILRFAETVRGAARFGAAGLGAAHVVVGFASERLQSLRDARIGGILAGRIALRLTARLTRLATD